jgi:hypothetical protein
MRAIARVNMQEYPRGRNCLEPIAVLIIAMIMAIANIVMILLSIQTIVTNSVR